MTPNRTIKILVKGEGDTKAVERAFRSSFDYVDREAKKTADNLKRVFSGLSAGVAPQNRAQSPAGGSSAMRAAQADIKRMIAEQSRQEMALTRQIEREAKQQSSVKIGEARRANVETIRLLKQAETEASRSSKAAQSAFSGSLGGSFFGTLGASAVSFFVGQISQLPSMVSDIIGKAVDISSTRLNAAKGLESIAAFKGIAASDAQDAVKNFRLVKAGIVDVGEATTALKNLFATGFSMPQAIQLFEAFSDTAAFGKQSALDYGQAIRGATEGLKNGQSVLVDNAGLTKNLSVILEENGKSQKDVMNITSDASVRQAVFNGLLKEAAGNTGDADKLTQGYTGSVAGLEQAYKNLYAAGGDLITQSPEMIAANKIQAEQVQSLTEDLSAQGSETSRTAQQWIVMWAQVKAATFGTASIIKNILGGVFTMASSMAAGVMGTVVGVFEGIESAIRFTLGSIINAVIETVNQAINLSKKLPLGLGGALQGMDAIEFRGNTAADFSLSKKLFAGASAAFAASDEYSKKLVKSVRETAASVGDVKTYADSIRNDRADELAKKDKDYQKYIGRDGRDLPRPNASKSAAVDGDKQKKGGSKKNTFAEIEAIGRNLDFVPTSSYRASGPNGATDHAGKGAVDFGFNTNNKKTLDDWTRLIIAGLTNDKQVIDERIVGYHPGIKGSKNVHLGNSDKKSLFLPQSYYSVPVEYLKELDAKRRSQKGLNVNTGEINEDYAEKARRAKEDESNKLTKAQKDKMVLKAIDAYKIAGLIPTGEMLNDFQALAIEEAKKTKKAQPTKEAVAAIFEASRQAKVDARGTIQSESSVGGDISPQATLDDKYVSNLRESLGLTKGKNEEESRYYNLIMRERNAMEEVSLVLEDQSLARDEAALSANIEYQVLLRRNSAEEVALKFIQSRNEQLRELGDTEQAINLLRRQNQDDQFADQRRLLASKREQLSLEQNITDLRDQIANGGKNDRLEIKAASLRDIVDLRRRELDAVISINRSQLELSGAMTVSNNQIRAQVYEHLASQQTLSQGIASGITGTYDALAGGLDKQIDKTFKWAGAFKSLFTEPLKAVARDGLSKITGGLLDSIFPGLGDIGKKTGNPMVDGINRSNKFLESIDSKLGDVAALPGILGRASGGGSSSSPSGGGIIGSIIGGISRIFGGGRGSSSGGALGRVALGGDGGSGGSLMETGRQLFGGSSSPSAGGGSIFSNLKKMFSTGEGGLFAPRQNMLTGQTSRMGGIMGGAGSLMAMAGGAIGGRFGGVLSGAGQGMQIGAMFGPWGAAIGAGIGALVGFIGAGKQRKADEKARTTAYVSAIAELDKLKGQLDARPPRVGWESALSQNDQIRASYYEQVNALKDKKTRNIALKTGREAIDPRFEAVKVSAAAARVYDYNRGETAKNFVGEFAGGVYMDAGFRNQYDGFKRRNGMMPGAYTGKDYIRALIGDGEVVANERQLNNMRRVAGFDVVAHAGIPNYKPHSSPQPVRASGGMNFAPGPAPVRPASINSNAAPDINIGDIVINLNGQRITDAEIESIAIGGITKFVGRNGRKV